MYKSLVLFTLLAFTACSSDTPEENNKLDATSTENTEVKTAGLCNPEAEPRFKGLLTGSFNFGDFYGGKVIDFDKLGENGYQFSEVEGEDYTVQHVFSPQMQEFLIIRESKKDKIITEMTLITRRYITDKCIGVNSSIPDFIAAYSDYEIGFDAGNDAYYFSTQELLGMKFNVLGVFFTGSNGSDSKRKYNKEDFQEGTQITNVSLSDF